jgi:hypothetical protein
MARAPKDIGEREKSHDKSHESAEHIFAPHGAMKEVALARFLAGGKWRLVARWLGLGIFIFGALLLLWVFWQALSGFQNFTKPDYLSSQLRRPQGDAPGESVLAGVIVFGTEFLRVLYLLLLGFLASVIAGKGIQFFAASEAIIDEAVVGDVDR